MALLFFDSFDHYATAEILQKYSNSSDTAAGNYTIGAFGRNSTQGGRFNFDIAGADGTICIERTLAPSGSTFIIGFAVNIGNLSNPTGLCSVRISGTTQLSLQINADGTLSVVRGEPVTGGTVLGTSGSSLSVSIYYYLEFKGLIDNAAGTYEVRINGSTVLSGSGADTRAHASLDTWDRVWLGSTGTTNSDVLYDVDDYYICDADGAQNNDFLGPIRVKAIYPDGAGNSTDFTPSAGSNFQNVDEALVDGDTTYNSETSAGDHDLYTYGALGITGTVKGVQTNLVVRSDGAGSETIRPKIRIDSTDYDGTTVAISTSYADSREVFELSPDSGVAWTVSEIDGAEFGIELVS